MTKYSVFGANGFSFTTQYGPQIILKKGKRKKGKRNNCSVSPSLYTKENPSKTLTNDKGISFCHSGVWTLILCHTIDSFDCSFFHLLDQTAHRAGIVWGVDRWVYV